MFLDMYVFVVFFIKVLLIWLQVKISSGYSSELRMNSSAAHFVLIIYLPQLFSEDFLVSPAF